MDGLEFINLLLRFHQRQEGKFSIVTFIKSGPGGMEETLVRGLLIVIADAGHRLYFDPERWTPVDSARAFRADVRGIMTISSGRQHQDGASALGEFQHLIRPVDPALVAWPLATPEFHTDIWGYAHD